MADSPLQDAELVRYETHLLRGRALGFWLCIRCGKVGTMAEWSASSFLCHHASLLLNDGSRCLKCGVVLSPDGHHLYATDCARIDGTGSKA